MKIEKIFKISMMLMLTIVAITALSQTSEAKSLYVIANINDSPTPINAYDILPNGTIQYQTTHDVPYHPYGAVGIAIDSDSEMLFVTYEDNNVIELINATTMTSIGITTAESADNLAGIVVDHDKSKIYTVDRNTNDLYIYSWNASNTTLYNEIFMELPNVSMAHGIALDEYNDLLYIGDRTTTVRYFDTTTWTEAGNFIVSQDAMGIALDTMNHFVYTGNAYPGYGSIGILSKYDLNTDTETTFDLRAYTGDSNDNVVGLAVDQDTQKLYITTGNQGSGGSDKIIAFESDFTVVDESEDIGDPTGLTIPTKDVSYNPLNLKKDDGLDAGECINPGSSLTYTLSYDNYLNENDVHNVTITDDLPTQVTFVSATDGGIYDSGEHTVIWDIGTLASGAAEDSVQVTVQVKSTTPGEITFTNYATIVSDETPTTTKSEETTTCESSGDDTTPPIQTVELGTPLIQDVYYTGTEWLDLIGSQTRVWINSSDDDSGVNYIKYKLFKSDEFGEWNDPDWVFVYDNQDTGDPFTTDSDPTIGRISIKFFILESCFHQIHAHCVDHIGNWNYSNPVDFLVDYDAPSNGEFTYIGSYKLPGGVRFINNETIKRIWANDTGCTGGVAGVDRIVWRIENSMTVTIANGTVYDNNPSVYEDEHVIVSGDLDSTPGKMMIEISLKEECIHFIYHQAIDTLENKESGRKELVHVDLTPPIINKTVGEPNCVVIPKKEYCITNETSITFSAEDDGCIGGVGLESLFYRIWNTTSGWTSWIEVDGETTIHIPEECTHYLEIKAIDYLGNWVIDNETFHVDLLPPTIIKTVGDPHCGPEWEGPDMIPGEYVEYFSDGAEAYCVTTATEITLNATDNGCCTSSLTIEYKKWKDGTSEPSTWSTYTTPFTFDEECRHYLLVRAYDCLGNGKENIEYWDLEIFYVDDQAPEIQKIVGDPNCTIIPGEEYCITSDTPIYINASNMGCCPSEFLMLQYKINDGDWTPVMLPAMIYLPEECTHTLTIKAWDCLNNTATDVETFHVDNSHPELNKTVGDPNCPQPMDCTMLGIPEGNVTMDFFYLGTYAYFDVVLSDVPMGYDIINGSYRAWCVDQNHTISNSILYNAKLYCSYDSETPWPDDDWDKVNYIINHKHPNATVMEIQQAIWYFINGGHYPPTPIGQNMVDEADMHGEGFMPHEGEYCAILCDTGNTSQKTFIEFRIPENYCVTTETEITLEGIDYPDCCPEDAVVEYKEWLADEPMPEEWMIYTAPFTFEEECKHYLLVRVYDCLGHGIDDPYWDLEIFYVDDQAPEIHKTVGEPNCTIVPGEEYCIKTTTPITIDAENMGCCIDDELLLRYKINDGDWIDLEKYPVTIYIEEECNHTLTIEASDCLGNTATDVELFHVDDTPPMIEKIVGDPYCGPEWENATSIPRYYADYFPEGVEAYCVNLSTDITLGILPEDSCCVSNVTIEYKIWKDGESEPKMWTPYTEPFNFDEECKHYLLVRAYDCLENGKYNVSYWDLEIFYVDEDGPGIIKEVGDPKVYLGLDSHGHDQWLVYPYTDINLSIDPEFPEDGCCPNETGTIEYRYWYLGEWTDWMIYTGPIHLTEGCVHYLEARAIDCLGNIGPIDNETFWVCGPSGDSGPTINFIEPTFGETRCDRTLEVIIDAHDEETEKEDLLVYLWIPSGLYGPTQYFNVEYNPDKYGDEFFHAFIDIYKYQNGTPLSLKAVAVDEDMNMEDTIELPFYVCSTVAYDKWMRKGWNQLIIPLDGIACSGEVEHVLASIHDYVDGVFYYDGSSWSSFIPGEPWNPWTEMQTGKTYWIYINKPEGIRYYTDTHGPTVSILTPEDGDVVNDTKLPYMISGEAMDVETGISKVQVSIYDNVTDEYWNGSAWTMIESWITCDGEESWFYNLSESASTGHLDHELILTAKAYDFAGCMATDSIWVSIYEEVCEECPEGSGATIVPDYLEVSMYPGETIHEIKNVTTDAIPIGKLDVMFLFDLTGSMGGVLTTAKTSAINIMNDIQSQVNDSAFGVGSFMDYPAYYTYCAYSSSYGSTSGDYPWSLDQDITDETTAVDTVIDSLTLGSGGDGPESYTRALWESQFASWRTGARKVVIIFGDNVPHDCNLEDYGYYSSTGVDPGRDAVAGTADDLSWNGTAMDLQNAGISVIAVHTATPGSSNANVWQYMVDETEGIYSQYGSTSDLPDEIVASIGNVTATIKHMTLQPSEGYEDWFDWTPEYHTGVPGNTSVEFDVDITVPEDADLGHHHICLLVMGDGAILAVQELDITVEEGAPETYSISGDVYSESRLCGEYAYICLFNDTYYTSGGGIDPIECYPLPLGDVAFGESLGSYLFEDLDEGSYYVTAYMDCNENLTFDMWEPAAAATNQSWWPDEIILDGSNVTDKDVTFYNADPNMTIEKKVWDDSIDMWMDSATVGLNDTVTFRVTFDNTGNTPLLFENLKDKLPSGLEYETNTTEAWMYLDDLVYHYLQGEIEPMVDTSGEDTVLSWFGEEDNIAYPNVKGILEFDVTVVDYGSLMNVMNCSVWYDETNYVHEDTATVICEEPTVSYSIQKYSWYWYYEKWDAAYAFARQPDNYASFKIEFEPTGDGSITGDIYIRDELPENLTYDYNHSVSYPAGLTLTASYFDPATHQMYFNFTGTLEPGEQIIIVFNATYTGDFVEMYSETNTVYGSTSIPESPMVSDDVPIHYNWWLSGEPEPVEGADVSMDWLNNSHYGYNDTMTDETGFYLMNRPGITDGDWDQLYADKMLTNGFGETLYLENHTDRFYNQPCEQWHNFTLYKPRDTATIHGHVYEKGTSNPIEATVNINFYNSMFSYNGDNSTTSDVTGYYEINLPPSNVTISVYATGYNSNMTTITIGAETKTVDIYLEPELEDNAVVRGYVKNKYTGEPIEGATVHFMDSPYSRLAFTDEFGYYNTSIAAGELNVQTLATNYIGNYTTVEISEGVINWFNVSLVPYTSVIKGYVNDSENGTNLVDAAVDLYNFATYVWNNTDGTGYYEIPVPGGNYTMEVYKDGYLTHYEGSFSNPIVSIGENESMWVNISLIPFPEDNAWLHLYVNDSMTGNAIEDVDLSLNGEIFLNVDNVIPQLSEAYDEGEFYRSTAVYNAMDGYYNISVPAVPHVIGGEVPMEYDVNVSLINYVDADKIGYYETTLSIEEAIEPGDVMVKELMLDPHALEPCLVKGYVYMEEL